MLKDITDITKNLTVNSEMFPFHAIAYVVSSTSSICLSKPYNDSLKKAIKNCIGADSNKSLLETLTSDFDDIEIELALSKITESEIFKEGIEDSSYVSALGASSLYYNILIGKTVYKIHAYAIVTEAMIDAIKSHIPELYFALENQELTNPNSFGVLDLISFVNDLPSVIDYFSIDVTKEFGPFIFKQQAESTLTRIGDSPFFLTEAEGSFDDCSNASLALFCAKQEKDNAVVLVHNYLMPAVVDDPALVLAHHTHLKINNHTSSQGVKSNG